MPVVVALGGHPKSGRAEVKVARVVLTLLAFVAAMAAAVGTVIMNS